MVRTRLPFARLGDCEFRADERPVRILVVDLFGGCAQTDKVVGAHREARPGLSRPRGFPGVVRDVE